MAFTELSETPIGAAISLFARPSNTYDSTYRVVTGSDWIFRRGLRSAGAPDVGDPVLDAFQAPFRVAGTAAAFKSMLRYGIQGVSEQTLRRLRGPRLVRCVRYGAEDTGAASRSTPGVSAS